MNKPSRRAYGLRTATSIVRLKDRNPTPIPSTFRRPDVREGAEAADRGRPGGIMGRVDDQFLDFFAWVAQVPGAGEMNAHLVFAVQRHEHGAGYQRSFGDLQVFALPDFAERLCQTNLNRYAKGAGLRRSGRKLTPFGQGGGAVLLECVAAVEVTVLIEMNLDRGVDGGKFLEGLHVPELCHRPLPSSERLMCVLRPIVEPTAALLRRCIIDHIHRSAV